MAEKKDDRQDMTRVVSDQGSTEEYRTEMLKTMFPGRTDAELVKINRNFLKDAEPFVLDRLINEVKKGPESLLTGFNQLDAIVRIPGGALTLVTGNRKQGKSLFMMNLMFNMTRQYKNRHFLYYTYEESRKNVELKLVNLAGDTAFESHEYQDDPATGLPHPTNLDVWRSKLKTLTEPELLKLASEAPSYRGLMNFLDVSSRIHIIDSCYPVSELIESVKLFNGPFMVGAVFVDFVGKIEPEGNSDREASARNLAVSHRLKRFISGTGYPMIMAAQYPPDRGIFEAEEGHSPAPGFNLGGIEQDADLIIDLQREKKGQGDFLNLKVLGDRVGPGSRCRLKFIRPLLKVEDAVT